LRRGDLKPDVIITHLLPLDMMCSRLHDFNEKHEKGRRCAYRRNEGG